MLNCHMVEDRTELPGRFDLTVNFSRDGQSAADAAAGPSIFTAFNEQLGLRLQATEGRSDVVLIDHVEPPTPNQDLTCC